MEPITSPAPLQASRDRRGSYNATVVKIHRVHSELMRMTVRPDFGRLDYLPGQYTTLGLGGWEPRAPGCQPEVLSAAAQGKVIRRAYSIAAAMVEAGRLCRPGESEDLEFFIVLVRQALKHPPALTPRLFLLEPGSRLQLGVHAHGRYLLSGVEPHHTVIFAATGTGEAPHTTMVADLLARGHTGRIVCLSCVRYRQDLGYLAAHRRLEALYPNYSYIPLTTREPENLDPEVPGYVGKRYLQDYFASGELTRQTGMTLSPEHSRVFLCGSPEMIGVPHHTHDPLRRYPQPRGMVEVLEASGFTIDRPHEPGTIHFEKYW